MFIYLPVTIFVYHNIFLDGVDTGAIMMIWDGRAC